MDSVTSVVYIFIKKKKRLGNQEQEWTGRYMRLCVLHGIGVLYLWATLGVIVLNPSIHPSESGYSAIRRKINKKTDDVRCDVGVVGQGS
jgi:hypothetical protein